MTEQNSRVCTKTDDRYMCQIGTITVKNWRQIFCGGGDITWEELLKLSRKELQILLETEDRRKMLE